VIRIILFKGKDWAKSRANGGRIIEGALWGVGLEIESNSNYLSFTATLFIRWGGNFVWNMGVHWRSLLQQLVCSL